MSGNDSYYRGTVETILVPITITYHDPTDIVYSCDVTTPLVDGMQRLEEAVRSGLRVENLHRAHQHLTLLEEKLQGMKRGGLLTALLGENDPTVQSIQNAVDILHQVQHCLKGGS